MEIAIIAARSINGVIGRCGTIPWQIPDDMRRFKLLTMGCTLIMGRRTWQSIGHALPGRTIIVLTRQSFSAAIGGVAVCPDISNDNTTNTSHSLGNVCIARGLGDALDMARQNGAATVWIAGGETVYHLCLPLAKRLCITEVLNTVNGDTYFPDFDESQYSTTQTPIQCGGTLDGGTLHYKFVTYTRQWLVSAPHRGGCIEP